MQYKMYLIRIMYDVYVSDNSPDNKCCHCAGPHCKEEGEVYIHPYTLTNIQRMEKYDNMKSIYYSGISINVTDNIFRYYVRGMVNYNIRNSKYMFGVYG